MKNSQTLMNHCPAHSTFAHIRAGRHTRSLTSLASNDTPPHFLSERIDRLMERMHELYIEVEDARRTLNRIEAEWGLQQLARSGC